MVVCCIELWSSCGQQEFKATCDILQSTLSHSFCIIISIKVANSQRLITWNFSESELHVETLTDNDNNQCFSACGQKQAFYHSLSLSVEQVCL